MSRAPSSAGSNAGLPEQIVGDALQIVRDVADNITDLLNVADNVDAILSAETDAVAAKTAAETAETNAETAETAAEAAQAAAIAARDVTTTARDVALAAQVAAETAKTAAETAETNAEAAAASVVNAISYLHINCVRNQSAAVETDQLLKTFALPAGQINTLNKCIRVTAKGFFAPNARTKTVNIVFGFLTISLSTNDPTANTWEITFLAYKKANSGVILGLSATSKIGSATGLIREVSEELSSSSSLAGVIDINLSGQVGVGAAIGDIASTLLLVEKIS
jgi:hypothetical protein